MKMENNTSIRLNKFIAQSGICSRRNADLLIKEGKIKVNGQKVTEIGFKIKLADTIHFQNKPLRVKKNIYLILNKPKGIITSALDEKGRTTVTDIVSSVFKERVFPVGRLDKDTSGLLLLTNDGELSYQLAHPKFNIKKSYEAKLNKPLEISDLEKIKEGIILEDGPVKIDKISYLNSKNRVKVDIHSGKNRIIRRIFEHLGYEVTSLSRISFASLSSFGLPLGSFRELRESEIQKLKSLYKDI